MANCKKPQNHSEPPPKSIQLSRLRSFTLASSMDAKAPTIPITPVKHAIVNRILGILIADLLGHLSSLAGHRRRTGLKLTGGVSRPVQRPCFALRPRTLAKDSSQPI